MSVTRPGPTCGMLLVAVLAPHDEDYRMVVEMFGS